MWIVWIYCHWKGTWLPNMDKTVTQKCHRHSLLTKPLISLIMNIKEDLINQLKCLLNIHKILQKILQSVWLCLLSCLAPHQTWEKARHEIHLQAFHNHWLFEGRVSRGSLILWWVDTALKKIMWHRKIISKIVDTMGVLTPGSALARPSARPPIDTSGNFLAHMSAECCTTINRIADFILYLFY